MSINFEFLRHVDPAFDRIGGYAERAHARGEYDLVAGCTRRLAELLVTAFLKSKQRPISPRQQFADWKHDLDHLAPPRQSFRGPVEELWRRGNEGAHAFVGQTAHPGDFGRNESLSLLQRAHRAGVWLSVEHLGGPGPAKPFQEPVLASSATEELAGVELRPPEEAPAGTAALRQFESMEGLIDQFELLARDPGAAEQREAVRREVTNRMGRQGWDKRLLPWQGALLQLRWESAQLADRNHAGLQTRTSESEDPVRRSLALMEHEAGRFAQEVLEFHARRGVALFNAYEFEQAERELSRLAEARRTARLADSALFGDAVSSYADGALFGSLGQAQCFVAWLSEDPDWIDVAMETFAEAASFFSPAATEDQERQAIYRRHALLERGRIGGRLSGKASTTRQEQAVESFLSSPFSPASRNDPFWTALSLKEAWLHGERHPRADALAQRLGAALDERGGPLPRNPFEQIVGQLLLQASGVPRSLRERYAARSQENSLSGMLASLYMLQVEHQAHGRSGSRADDFLEQLPRKTEWPEAAWRRQRLDERLRRVCAPGGIGPLSLAPLNYA